MTSKSTVQKILNIADIKVNGSRPEDIRIHNEKIYNRVLAGGSLALGESYMDGWWSCKSLDKFFTKVLRAQLERKIISGEFIANLIKAKFFNMQTRSRSKKVAQEHYDLGNEFYKDMLDKNMQYTCGYWKNAKTLDKAQEQKLDLVCRKLQLKKGDKVLELGCGWGGFAHYAAKKYGCHVTGYNISKEQVAYAREWCKGLPVTIHCKDYREARGQYDKVVSVGMCEHVGYRNYREFMELAHDRLKKGGLFVMHTIGGNRSVKMTDPWIAKYIFPNSMLPSVKQLATAAEELFVMEDWHNFGADYDKTLLAWHANFKKHWKKHEATYGERFYRMWEYYLLVCAASFRSRKNQLWQVVYSKGGVPGGYTAPR